MCFLSNLNYLTFRTSIFIRKMSSSCNIAVCQFTATNNKEHNFEVVARLVQNAACQKAKMVFLPEACDFIALNKDEAKALSEKLDGQLIAKYKRLAVEHKLWLSIGGFHEKIDNSTAYNSHIIIDNIGEIQSIYRKIHMFDVSIPEKNVFLRESDSTCSGSQILQPCDTPAGKLGLSICYDLRFPELSTLLTKFGAEILTYPSAFTNVTGKAHWELLLRARAVENQCFLVAAAQYGKHNEKRTSYGHAMVVDPWGKILAECPKYAEGTPTNESIGVAKIDLDYLKKVRKEMPVFSHRRNDIYNLNYDVKNYVCNGIDRRKSYNFADKIIPLSTVFCTTKYCFAFTNIRCVVPGHVLVAPIRPAQRLQDLSNEEVADLFQTAVKVSKVVELVQKAGSSTVCVQDGQFAGQTVPHVHVHILPRKLNDFENNDDIYMHLAKHDTDNSAQAIRCREEQEKEALNLRKHF